MKKVIIIGGDDRLKNVEKDLINAGFDVKTLGLYENDSGDIKSSDIIILPVPTTKDNSTVYTPLTHKQIFLKDIEKDTVAGQLILCCNYNFENRSSIDYGAIDSYALLNAIPTAEGAIKIAIENTPYTLWKSRVLVIGYGRVGKILAQRLYALGCDVTVSARKHKDFAFCEALGYKTADTRELNLSMLDYDIIFNTVDVKVIENNALKTCRTDLLIDLSSKGGFDFQFAKEAGLNAIKAPGLPGIIAPITAGKILSKTITELVS